MSHVIRWFAGLLAACAALLVITPVALAQATAPRVYPPEGGAAGSGGVTPLPHLTVPGGTPGWQIIMIAVGSALAAAAMTLLADRAIRRKARRAMV